MPAASGSWGRWRAFRPSDAAWAVGPAGRVVLAAGAIAVIGAATGGLASVGVMYFGAACAAVFSAAGEPRTRMVTLIAQGAGAASGLALGSIGSAEMAARIGVAAVVAMASGMIGAIGTVAATAGLMSVIGVAYAQFSGLPMPWWQAASWYLVGTLAVFVASLFPWLIRRRAYERDALSAVLAAASDLVSAIGTPGAAQVRTELAMRSAAAREEFADRRLPSRVPRGGNRATLTQVQGVAFAAAALYAEGRQLSPDVRVRIGEAVRTGAPVELGRPPTDSPALALLVSALAGAGPGVGAAGSGASPVAADAWLRPFTPSLLDRFRSGMRAVFAPSALLGGVRLALCMAIATAVTSALHSASHSYWLPLTVAVVVRPEFASVFVRTVNRVAGTLAGAALAAAALTLVSTGWAVAAVAALAIGFAVLAAPKLYGLSVVGVTCSALLSASIASPDPAYPGIRVLDTLLGCAIAIVFGYILWPGRGTLPPTARLEPVADALVAYLRFAALPVDRRTRTRLSGARDRAYDLAHRTRAAVYAALSDPPPVSARARAALPVALAFEDLADAITAFGVRAGSSPAGDIEGLTERITALAHLGGAEPRQARAVSGPGGAGEGGGGGGEVDVGEGGVCSERAGSPAQGLGGLSDPARDLEVRLARIEAMLGRSGV